MDDKVLKAALAGLLHDIGKFAQRIRSRPSRVWDAEAEREYKYEHAVFSGDFVERYLPNALKPLSPPAYHHAPQSELDRLIQLADRLSAGERDTEVDRARQPKSLRRILGQVQLFDTDGQPLAPLPPAAYWPLRPLALAEDVLLSESAPEPANDDLAYEALWQGFIQEAEALKLAYASSETYLEGMLNALQRYAWCVPSAYYRSVPDISLYDHSRMTAALAVCLSSQPAAQIGRWLEGQDPEVPAALLVGGDLSGVQGFIYTLSSKKAAKTLRGRSFYLQLLTEAILRFMLRQLDLPYTNVIYSGGGHFYLIAPVSAQDRLGELQKSASEILLTHHNTALYLALGSAPVPAGGFRVGEFHRHWNAMHRDLGRAKQQRYRELGQDMYGKVFEPAAHGGNREQTCAVCGEESLYATTLGEPDDPQAKICPLCASFETLVPRPPKCDGRRAHNCGLSAIRHPSKSGGRGTRR
jgi:CRISPR-associated protein Csm1